MAPPTGAPGHDVEADRDHAAGERAADEASPGSWEAEAERLRRERPPHWG